MYKKRDYIFSAFLILTFTFWQLSRSKFGEPIMAYVIEDSIMRRLITILLVICTIISFIWMKFGEKK